MTLKRTGSTVGRRESHGESQLRKKLPAEEEPEKEKEKEPEKEKGTKKGGRGFARKLTSMVLSKEEQRPLSEYAVGMTLGEFGENDFLHRGVFHAWSQDYEDFALPITFGVYATEIFVFENGILAVVLPRERVVVKSLGFKVGEASHVFDVGCFEGTRSYFARLSTGSGRGKEEWCQLLHSGPGEEIPVSFLSFFEFFDSFLTFFLFRYLLEHTSFPTFSLRLLSISAKIPFEMQMALALRILNCLSFFLSFFLLCPPHLFFFLLLFLINCHNFPLFLYSLILVGLEKCSSSFIPSFPLLSLPQLLRFLLSLPLPRWPSLVSLPPLV